MTVGRRFNLEPRQLNNRGGNYVTHGSIDTLAVSSPNRRLSNGAWSGGGPFFQYSEKWKVTPTLYPYQTSFKDGSGNGMDSHFIPTQTALINAFAPVYPAISSLYKPSYSGSILAATPYGTKLWRRARLGNPTASMGQFIGELRDLPRIPVVLYRKLAAFRELGSEYLNVKFGWLPFVKDLREMYETHLKLQERLDQLVRDNGRGIRRKRSLGESVTRSVTEDSRSFWTFLWPSPFGPSTSYPSKYVREDITTEEFWFAGRFRYYVPDIGSSQWTRRATKALYGVNPTPSLLWELLPWSWLLDWFGNVGDVLSNLSSNAVENQVADYAYIMHRKSVLVRHTVTAQALAHAGNSVWNPVKAFDSTCSSEYEKTQKLRFAATPYGIGITYSSLSSSQTAVLAALGISRAKF